VLGEAAVPRFAVPTPGAPLLITSGEKDHTVPWAISNASYKKQKRNEGVTEIVEIRPSASPSREPDRNRDPAACPAMLFYERET
jgi:non-heme chloroperoxidase